MHSGAVRTAGLPSRREIIRGLAKAEENFSRWMEHPASAIVQHDNACCDEARLWFLSYARSMEVGFSSPFEIKAPVWLSDIFQWGPTSWPIAWCEVVRKKIVDCGVFAALTREVFRAQGHLAHPAQALLSYHETCTQHWRSLWDHGSAKPKQYFPWVGKEMVYHELCLLEMPDGQAKVYDSTWGSWFYPYPQMGFGAVLAVRSECPRLLRWGNRTLSCGEWVEL